MIRCVQSASEPPTRALTLSSRSCFEVVRFAIQVLWCGFYPFCVCLCVCLALRSPTVNSSSSASHLRRSESGIRGLAAWISDCFRNRILDTDIHRYSKNYEIFVTSFFYLLPFIKQNKKKSLQLVILDLDAFLKTHTKLLLIFVNPTYLRWSYASTISLQPLWTNSWIFKYW